MAQQTTSYPCENCKFRASYDKNPKSLKGRFHGSRYAKDIPRKWAAFYFFFQK